MDTIILAGGLGTRLRGITGELPKCMASVNNNPFLHYLLLQLKKNNLQQVILSLGYRHKTVEEWVDKNNPGLSISCIVEHEPLGTGGAIKAALQQAQTDDVLVLNGDTYFDINIGNFIQFHRQHQAELSIALKPMCNFDRYGTVSLDDAQKIINFHEKAYCSSGLINGGCYIIRKESSLISEVKLSSFSFEKEVLEKRVKTGTIFGFVDRGYFIDIGIPDDYAKANRDFKVLFG
jgi:D-glycero-alpha-D-manno-heptose 1-phosphate guanylyltransferase